MKLFKSGGRGPAEMPFLDHLEELRWRILWSLLAVLIGTGIGFYLVNHYQVLELLIDPIRPYLGPDPRLGYLSPTDPFFIVIQLSITVGLLLAFPVVAAQAWGFISPALHTKEKRAIVPALYLGLVLFMCGVALAYFVVLPMTFRFMQSFLTTSLRQQIVVGPYIAVVTKVLLAFGAVFEMPVVVMVLSALGIVSSKFLSSQRRFAIAASAIMACILTPGDAVTISVFMMGPIILLYELSIALARLMERRRRKAEESGPLPTAAMIVLLAAATAFLPGSVHAQQRDTTRAKTPQQLVKQKLQGMGKESPRDTTPKTDSAKAVISRARADSTRLSQQSVAPPDMPRDSLMQLLAELTGFTATQYKGTTARFNADTGKLVLTASTEQKASVLQGKQSLTADSLLTYNRATTVACGYGKPLLIGETTQAPVVSELVCYNTRDKVGTAIGANT